MFNPSCLLSLPLCLFQAHGPTSSLALLGDCLGLVSLMLPVHRPPADLPILGPPLWALHVLPDPCPPVPLSLSWDTQASVLRWTSTLRQELLCPLVFHLLPSSEVVPHFQ